MQLIQNIPVKSRPMKKIEEFETFYFRIGQTSQRLFKWKQENEAIGVEKWDFPKKRFLDVLALRHMRTRVKPNRDELDEPCLKFKKWFFSDL